MRLQNYNISFKQTTKRQKKISPPKLGGVRGGLNKRTQSRVQTPSNSP